MKILLKALAIFVLAALGAGAVIYIDAHCPQKQAKIKAQIEEASAKYVENHSDKILENIAKHDEFGNAVRNFSGINDEELNEKIRTIIANNPELIANYIRDNKDFVAASVLESEAFKNISITAEKAENNENEENSEETASVFKEHWADMLNNDVSASVGPKDAKVTVVEFFDFACGHCRALAPIMSQLVKKNPDVRFIFNPLYFISEYSPYAAKVSLAAAQKGKFTEVFEGIMTLPDMNENTINQILTDEGLDISEIKKMIEEKRIRRGVQDIDALSQVLGINGVPMIIINGDAFYGRSLEDLQNKINSYK